MRNKIGSTVSNLPWASRHEFYSTLNFSVAKCSMANADRVAESTV